jgi:hypothetical protein
MYFQLYPSTHHTEGIESGLLPTPQAMDIRTDVRKPEERSTAANNGGCSNLREWAGNGLLPTPTAMDSTNATATMKSTQVKEGSMHSVTLTRALNMGMIPTPRTRDWKGCEGRRGDIPSYIEDNLGYKTGKTSQLSPQFVMEMMGFPTDWTLLPFLNGETSQSKQEEMQSFRK